jgi:hypothetical protein
MHSTSSSRYGSSVISLFPYYHFELMMAKKKTLPGEACESVPVNLLDDVADVTGREHSGLGGGCLPRP